MGAVLRELVLPLMLHPVLWVPVLFINAIGSFIIGIVYGVEQKLHPRLKDFYAIGFCGGFSTFSHFTYQTVHLMESGIFMSAILNVFLSISLVIIAVVVGMKLGKLIASRK